MNIFTSLTVVWFVLVAFLSISEPKMVTISLDIGDSSTSQTGAQTQSLAGEHKKIVKEHLRSDFHIYYPVHSKAYRLLLRKIYYFGWVEVGTPPQKVLVMFDTGSADFWFLSNKICIGKEKSYCKDHHVFDNTKSRTYIKDGRKFYIKYLTGSTKGFVGKDDISILGLKVKGQIFAEATEIDPIDKIFMYDGILGLGFTANSEIPADPPFINMIKQKVVDQPVFVFYLSKNKRKAELSLGGVDSTLYTGSFVYAPVVSNISWLINIDKITVNNKQVLGQYRAIPDSGTALVRGPANIINAINKSIGKYNSKGGYHEVDCTTIKSLPTVSIVVNKRPLPLKPEEYVMEFSDETGTKTICVSGFMISESLNIVILGELFMKAYYTQYDVGQRRVGFARAK